MQPLFIGDGGASRSTPFEGGGDDEDIPDQAKDPGGEAEPQEVKAKKSPASGRGTTALAAVLPRHGTTVITTALVSGFTVAVTVVVAVLPRPRYYRANYSTTVLPARRNRVAALVP